MLKRTRWLNAEVGVFLASSSFLFIGVLWYAFSGPEQKEWGPVAVRTGSPDWPDLTIDPSQGTAVLRRYKSGKRQNPFLPLQRRAVDIGRIKPKVMGPGRTNILPKKPKPTKAKRPPPKPKREKKKPDPKDERKTPKPWEKPMHVKGAWRVVGGQTVAIFESKETGEKWSVREGDEIAELGVKVVKVTPSVIIVENEKGERFRLQDLIQLGEQEE